MADTKITALTALTAADPANDVIPIVDVSDTSMAASGTTKKISVNNILGASGTATLASATVTGAATVGTTLGVTGVTTVSGAHGGGYSLTLANTTSNATAALKIAGGGTLGGGEIDFFNGANSWAGIKAAVINQLEFLSSTFATLMTINSTGVVVLKGGTVAANGVGVAFPATQVASSDANCLDDYEEGTFTPTIVGLTTAGVGVYTLQQGKYTKVGNLVTFQVFITWTAHTGTGNMIISNLPFTSGANFWSGSIGYANNIALTAGKIMTGSVEANTAYVNLQQYATGGGASGGIPIDTAGEIMFSASYTV